MIALRSENEIAILREANQIVAEVLTLLASMVEPGVATGELDAVAGDFIRRMGGKPSFLGYRGYPRSICVSPEEVVVHGIPGKRKLKAGQIVSIDVGVFWNGYHGDAAITVPCGKIDKVRQRLLHTTDRALARAVQAARAGNHIEDVSRVVQETCEAEGFSVVRALVGHGVGTALHEDLQVPNYVTGHRGPKLRPGMVFAIEPMVNVGASDVRVLGDGWTTVTADGKPSAHFEHSIAVREEGPEILSATSKLVWGQLPGSAAPASGGHLPGPTWSVN